MEKAQRESLMTLQIWIIKRHLVAWISSINPLVACKPMLTKSLRHIHGILTAGRK
jgi:hypothetical protein